MSFVLWVGWCSDPRHLLDCDVFFAPLLLNTTHTCCP